MIWFQWANIFVFGDLKFLSLQLLSFQIIIPRLGPITSAVELISIILRGRLAENVERNIRKRGLCKRALPQRSISWVDVLGALLRSSPGQRSWLATCPLRRRRLKCILGNVVPRGSDSEAGARTRALGAQVNKDGGVRAGAEKDTGGRARARAAAARSYQAAERTEKGRGRSYRPKEEEKGLCSWPSEEKGAGPSSCARRCRAPGTGGRAGVCGPCPPSSRRRRLTAVGLRKAGYGGGGSGSCEWILRVDEGRRKAPAAPAARCLPGLRPPAWPPPAPPPGHPLRPNRRISGTCTTSPTRCS